MVAILQRRKLRDFDWLIALLAITIVGFGAWEIHNAQPTEPYWQKQLIGLGIALVAMLAEQGLAVVELRPEHRQLSEVYLEAIAAVTP